ncbi:MAG: MarR family winged helix-turn-helix transcriptional regulator [Alphaproteobacteria bacterium]
MVDLKSNPDTAVLREEDLRQGIELMFYAYRDFTGEPDEILEQYSLGRAHHRVIYFVGRNPGISVTELLDILRITKQSLSRVLGKLIGDEFINQRPNPDDRRRKQLTLSEKGKTLEHALTSTQIDRFVRAYREAGDEAVEGFRRVLTSIINPEDRARVRPSTIRRG